MKKQTARNPKLHKESEERSNEFFEAMRRIDSELEIKGLIAVVFSELHRLFPCRRVRLFLSDYSSERNIQAFRSSVDGEGNIAAETIDLSRNPSDVLADQTSEKALAFSSTINLRLTADDGDVGLLSIIFPEFCLLSDFDLESLKAIAARTGTAIVNVLKSESEKRRVAHRSIMSELGRRLSLVASQADADAILMEAIEAARGCFGFDAAGIYLTDRRRRNYFRAFLTEGKREVSVNTIEAAGSLFERVVRNGEWRIVEGKSVNEKMPCAGDSIESFLAIPVKLHGASAGALCFESSKTGVFNEETLGAVREAAEQFSIVVLNDRLFRQAQSCGDYMQAVFDAAADMAIISADLEGRITAFNQGASNMFAVSPSEILGTQIAGLFLGSEAESGVGNLFTFQNQYLETDARLSRKDGRSFIAHMKVRPLEESLDRPAGYILLLTDVTERVNLQERLHRMTITDELTGLYNQRYFQTIIARETARARRSGGTFALCSFSLDGFKQYNESEGRQSGDSLLKWVAEVVTNQIRKHVDLAFRKSGDEFALILPGTAATKAALAGERIRMAVEAKFARKVAVSFGVTEHLIRLTTEEMIKRAENMMYEAKRGGGNRVAVDEIAALNI